jgi:NAD(P)-dependent dehydrogenase (short-subunit alcohol dehydrogenase family)
MPRPASESVAVITGAGSGIGRCTALRFAEAGARLTLGARSSDELGEVERECRARGAEVVVVPTDVAQPESVERLADACEGRFGRIDKWINNAGVMAYGRFDAIPPEVFRGVIETNLFGHVHGARAALRRFVAQGEGVLINVSSVWGRVTSPLVSPYVASKHAIRAFSECLRFELEDAPDIHVSTVLPEATDTPIFRHAANHLGRSIRPIPPMLDPWKVAEGIVMCAESPKREVTFGRSGRALELLYAIAPRLYCRIAPGAFAQGTLGSRPAPLTSGNVASPLPGSPEGGWRGEGRPAVRRAIRAALIGAVRGGAGGGVRTPPQLPS